eukprot:scaffold78834_cov20-Tisochrysis_lutea.AAC.1
MERLSQRSILHRGCLIIGQYIKLGTAKQSEHSEDNPLIILTAHGEVDCYGNWACTDMYGSFIRARYACYPAIRQVSGAKHVFLNNSERLEMKCAPDRTCIVYRGLKLAIQ